MKNLIKLEIGPFYFCSGRSSLGSIIIWRDRTFILDDFAIDIKRALNGWSYFMETHASIKTRLGSLFHGSDQLFKAKHEKSSGPEILCRVRRRWRQWRRRQCQLWRRQRRQQQRRWHRRRWCFVWMRDAKKLPQFKFINTPNIFYLS